MSKYRRQYLEDQAKKAILIYAAKNPQWTPESLLSICKFFIRHYGLKNRYLPPDFKKEESKDDTPGTETNPVGQTESGGDTGTVGNQT